MPLLSLEDIRMNFGERSVLDGISMRINEGDRIAFIGDNGAGKSTLFKIIKGTYTPDGGNVILHGNTIVGFLSQNMEEQDLSGESLKPKRLLEVEEKKRELEYLISDKSVSEEQMRSLISDYDECCALFDALGGYDYEFRLKDALGGLGLSEITDRTDYSRLSGGEKMRVCLARLIVESPDILLLDEPTNHLDMEAVEWLEEFLSSYKGAVFVITHDRHFIDSTANRVIELDNGHITEYKGNYTDYKEQKEAFLKYQTQRIANLEEELNHQLEVKQTMLSHRNISGYHQREKVVDKLEDVLEREKAKLPAGFAKMNFKAVPTERTGASDKILLSCKEVSKVFEDDNSLLFENISFELKADEKIFLCGPNGCGKTTLLTMLLGRSGGFEGTVLISKNIKCGYMGQFVPFDDEELNLFEELVSRSDLTVTEARNLLARFGFRGEDVFKQIKVLSGGERSRLYLCCLLNERPDILFLDEPTNHLDINSREILEDAIKLYDGSVIAVSHDRFFIEKCADKILGFKDKTAELYDEYRFYRQAFKVKTQAAPKEVQKEVPVPEESPKPATNANVNRSKLRKELAKKRERVRELENLITELEEETKQMQESFGPDTKEEEYKAFADRSEELKHYYDEYFVLSEELEE